MSDETLSGDQFVEENLSDWRPILKAVEARFATGDFATGLQLVQRIGEVAEEANHHPDVTLTYPSVNVLLTSHDVGGLTARDVEMARTISGIAAEMGVDATPEKVQRLELALDTWDVPAMKRFWVAALGLPDGDVPDEVSDPMSILPTLWFQECEEHPEPAQRFHLDLWLPPELVEDRLEAALAAGGTLVSDEPAPSFWIVADPQGNKVCFCTHRSRPA